MTTSVKKVPAGTKTNSKPLKTSATPIVKTAVKPSPKPEIKPKAKPAIKAIIKTSAPSVASVVPAVVEKAEKPKKVKLVRDSFTVPKNELNVLGDLKLRALSMKVGIKKSELLRAGIKALAAMDDVTFLTSIKAVPTLKTGRPKK